MYNEKRAVVNVVQLPLSLSSRELKCVMNGIARPAALVVFFIMIKMKRNKQKTKTPPKQNNYISFSKQNTCSTFVFSHDHS